MERISAQPRCPTRGIGHSMRGELHARRRPNTSLPEGLWEALLLQRPLEA